MSATAEKVTHIEDGKDLVQFGKALVEFDIEGLTAANVALMEEQILEIPEKPETKEQYDLAYRFNVDAKKILPKIEERRKELKAPVLQKGKDIDETAKKAKSMVQPVIELSGARREAWEAEKAAEKAEKERQEAERLAAIQAKMDMLNRLAAKPLEYNRASEDLARDLVHIESFEISAVDFQERTEEAEQIRANAIAAAGTALENRKKFEADQAEAARVKAENDAKEKELAEQQAKLDAKEAEMAAKQYTMDWDEALAINFNIDHEQAIIDHNAWLADRAEQFNRDHASALIEHEQFLEDYWHEVGLMIKDAQDRWARTEKAKAAAAEREKLIGPDRMMITTICTDLDKLISDYEIPALNAEEANALVLDMVTTLKETIQENEQRGADLA